MKKTKSEKPKINTFFNSSNSCNFSIVMIFKYLLIFMLPFYNRILVKCCHPRFFPGSSSIQFVPSAILPPFRAPPIIVPQSQWPYFINPFLGLNPGQLAALAATNPSFLTNPYFLRAYLPTLNTFQLSSLITQFPALLSNPQFTSSLVSSLNPAQLGTLINSNPNLLTYPTFIPALTSLPSTQLNALFNSGTLNPQLAAQLASNPSIQQAIQGNGGSGNSIQQFGPSSGSSIQFTPSGGNVVQQIVPNGGQQQIQPQPTNNGGGDGTGIQKE